MDRLWKWIARIVAIAIVGLLVACSAGGNSPDAALVKKAIAVQLHLTQEQLNSPLNIERSPQLEIKGVTIAQSDRLRDRHFRNLPTFHIQGTYNVKIKLSKQAIEQRKNPFDIYVQQQIEGKTWRLLRPQVTPQETKWLSYQI